MTDTPSETEVRAWLGECVQELDEVARGYTKTIEETSVRWSHYAACARAALAQLDEGRRPAMPDALTKERVREALRSDEIDAILEASYQCDRVCLACVFGCDREGRTPDPLALAKEIATLRAQLAAAQAENARLRAVIAAAEQVAQEAWSHWDADRDSKVGKLLRALAGVHGIRVDLDEARRALALIDEGQEDRERMEWWSDDPHEKTRLVTSRWYEGGTWREAIDAARAATHDQPEEGG